ncbi:MAG: Gfo/Idh/MocA family oxidoreductase [Thermoproteota archaeon]
MKYIRFGLAGTGTGAELVAKGFKTLSTERVAELSAVFSRNMRRAEAFASKYGVARSYNDYDEMIRNAEIDAVAICTPHYLHHSMGTKAIERGLHVLIDKPLAVNLKESDELISSAEKKGVKLGVILQNRFDDSVMLVKKTVDEGSFGRLLLGTATINWFRNEEYYSGSMWRGKWATEGGGVLINQAIHTIDLLVWIMGDVEGVWGNTDTLFHRIEVEDIAVACLKMKNGALGMISASTAMYPGFPTRLEIYGTDGCALFEGFSLKYFMVNRREQLVKPVQTDLASWSRPEAVPAINHSRLVKDFAQAIIENRKPRVDGREGRKSLEVVMAIYESSRTGRKVFLKKV